MTRRGRPMIVLIALAAALWCVVSVSQEFFVAGFDTRAPSRQRQDTSLVAQQVTDYTKESPPPPPEGGQNNIIIGILGFLLVAGPFIASGPPAEEPSAVILRQAKSEMAK
eukprot:TRINITY_DN38905_c0_g1_i1.p1 TRINITY_DN38905_c0_g1~~TRINITY_DN38905_c0_g1_i1.p1  ORF type:complete len:110 (-),score=25.67 TRINITY_DN38905_c0_g1_i1:327-656(-)